MDQLTNSQKVKIEKKRLEALEKRKAKVQQQQQPTPAVVQTRPKYGEWEKRDPTELVWDTQRAYKRHQAVQSGFLAAGGSSDAAWVSTSSKKPATISSTSSTATPAPPTTAGARPDKRDATDIAMSTEEEDDEIWVAAIAQSMPPPPPPPPRLALPSSTVFAVAAAAPPPPQKFNASPFFDKHNEDELTSLPPPGEKERKLPAVAAAVPTISPSAALAKEKRRPAPEDFRCSPSPSSASPQKRPKAAEKPAPFAMPGHVPVNCAKALREFAQQTGAAKKVAVAHYMSNGVSSFRSPKAFPPSIKSPEVAGLSILPERAKMPFFVDLSNPADTSEITIEMIDVVQALFGSTAKKICFDSQVLHRALSSKFSHLLSGLEFGAVFDSKVAAWVVNPDADEQSLAFVELIFEHLSAREAPGLTVPEYLASDMRNSLVLAEKLEKLIRKDSLVQGLSFETLVIPILAEMESNGVVFNPDGFKRYKQQLQDRLYLIDTAADRMVGFKVNLSSPKQVGHVLFEVFKLQAPGKSGKANPSTSETAIKKLCDKHPFPRLVLEHRHTQKLLSQYVFSLEEKARIEGDIMVIHSQWCHTSTGTGRLSSVNPNLQNLPRGTVTLKPVTEEDQPVTLNIRDAFSCRPGFVLIASDYSQIELRVLAHFTKDERLISAFREGTDFHSIVASKVCGKAITAVSEEERTKAKRVVFGVLYGMGINTLAELLKVGKPEAIRWRDSFFAQFPGVQKFISETVVQAKREQFVKTLLGRRRLATGINSENKVQRARAERQAVNAIIQGSAADIMKAAMVRLWDRLAPRQSRLVLQIHDEIVIEAPIEQREEICRVTQEVMEHPLPEGVLLVPIPVKISVGERWGSLEPYQTTEGVHIDNQEDDSMEMTEDSEFFE